jgi:hypothetical protein
MDHTGDRDRPRDECLKQKDRRVNGGHGADAAAPRREARKNRYATTSMSHVDILDAKINTHVECQDKQCLTARLN